MSPEWSLNLGKNLSIDTHTSDFSELGSRVIEGLKEEYQKKKYNHSHQEKLSHIRDSVGLSDDDLRKIKGLNVEDLFFSVAYLESHIPKDMFKEWFRKPLPALQNRTALDLIFDRKVKKVVGAVYDALEFDYRG